MDDKLFYCKGKTLADYLVKKGCNLVKKDCENGKIVYVFINNDTLKENLDKFDKNIGRCMF